MQEQAQAIRKLKEWIGKMHRHQADLLEEYFDENKLSDDPEVVSAKATMLDFKVLKSLADDIKES